MRTRKSFSALGGAFTASFPLPVILVQAGMGSLLPAAWAWGVSGLASACLLLGGAGILWGAWWGRLLGSFGVLASLALSSRELIERPGVALLFLMVALVSLFMLWTGPLLGEYRSTDPGLLMASRVRGAGLSASVLSILVSFQRGTEGFAGALPWLGVSILVALGFLGVWLARYWRHFRIRSLLIVIVALAGGGIASLTAANDFLGALLFGVVILVFGGFALPRAGESGGLSDTLDWWEPVLSHPERLLVSTFFFLCLSGSILLALPRSSSSGTGIPFIDAAFTAVSAVCVTGLIVLDTPVAFSPFGQFGIILLIQLGGLGIMTFSTLAIRIFGRRLSLRHEGVVARLISSQDRSRMFSTARDVLLVTLACEAVGALLLTIRFLSYHDRFPTALWRGVFTSVSAFCNAGFALQSTNLVPYQEDPWILHTVGLLIILGGLSPLVVLALPRFVRRNPGPVPAQVKLILATTGILLAAGFLFMLAAEWSHQLAGLGFWDRLHNAWFQSITTRTAGHLPTRTNLRGFRPSPSSHYR